MPELIDCPSCRRQLKLNDALRGKQVRCPACGECFVPASPLGSEPLDEPVPAASLPDTAVTTFQPDGPRDERIRPRVRSLDGSPDERDDTRKRRLKRKKSRVGLSVGILCGIVVWVGACVAFYLFVLHQRDRRQPVRHEPEDADERREEVMEAFRRQKPLDTEEIRKEIQPFLEALGVAFRDRNEAFISAQFDAERIYEELLAQEVLPASLRRSRRDFIRGMQQAMGPALGKQAELFQWKAVEIRGIKKLEGNEAVVIARHESPHGVYLKMRWWLSKRSGRWKVFDLEDLDFSMRFSTGMGLAAGVGEGRIRETTRSLEHLRNAMMALALREDVEEAERQFKQIGAARLPGKIESLRHVLKGLIALHRFLFQEALAALDEAHRINPDMPCLDLFRGMTYNRLGEWGRGLKHLEAYHKLLGDDHILCHEMGESLRGVHRFADAATSYRKALDANPRSAESFQGLLDSLAAGDRRDDLAARFARLDDRPENFEAFAEACRATQHKENLTALVAAMRGLEPNYPTLEFHEALAAAWAGREDEAVRLFRVALTKQPDEERRKDHSTKFMEAMAKIGKAEAAYSAVPDSREAFRYLAAESARGYRSDDLRRLVSAHRKKQSADPLLPFYQGEVHVRHGEYRLAEEAFQEGMKRPPAPEVLDTFRASGSSIFI